MYVKTFNLWKVSVTLKCLKWLTEDLLLRTSAYLCSKGTQADAGSVAASGLNRILSITSCSSTKVHFLKLTNVVKTIHDQVTLKIQTIQTFVTVTSDRPTHIWVLIIDSKKSIVSCVLIYTSIDLCHQNANSTLYILSVWCVTSFGLEVSFSFHPNNYFWFLSSKDTCSKFFSLIRFYDQHILKWLKLLQTHMNDIVLYTLFKTLVKLQAVVTNIGIVIKIYSLPNYVRYYLANWCSKVYNVLWSGS